MADKTDQEDAPATKSAQPTDKVTTTDSTTGALSASVYQEATNLVSNVAKNVAEQFQQFSASIASLDMNRQGLIDPKTKGLYDVPIVNQEKVGARPLEVGNAPRTFSEVGKPGAANPAEVPKLKVAAKQPEAAVSDGTINIKPDVTQEVSAKVKADIAQEVAKLNQHLKDDAKDGRHHLSEDQRADLELSAERLVSNKNPDGSPRNPPLDAAEIAKVLHQANRMFDRTDSILANKNAKGEPLTKEERNLAVVGMIHDIADPLHAGQGLNNACASNGAAKAEMLIKPGEQARRMGDAYTNESEGSPNVKNEDKNGKFILMDTSKPAAAPGNKVYYDLDSIRPDKEAAYAAKHNDGTFRDGYMQGLTHIYANSETQKRGEFYKEVRTKEPGDTGERLMKGGFNGPMLMEPVPKDAPPGTKPKPVMNPRLTGDDVANLNERLGIGKLAINFEGMGIKPPHAGNMRDVKTSTGADLDLAWKENGGKPMVIAVDSNAAMFIDAAGGGKGGGHVVMVSAQRYNEKTKENEYFLHNWGEKNSGWVSGDALASSMNPAKGDRSAAVPIAASQETTSISTQDKVLTRPPKIGTPGTPGTGETSDYEGGNGAKRDPNGILIREQREAELSRREQLKQQDQEQALKRDEARKKEEDEARNRNESYRKKMDEDEAKRRDEAAKKQKEQAAKQLLENEQKANDPNNPDNKRKKR